MKRRCQLAIIGAGPAGGYAALTAARAGLDVLLLERDNEIGKPLMCAEAISETGLLHFIEADDGFISTEIYGVSLESPGGFVCSYKAPTRLGFVLDRCQFDQYLAKQAQNHGAEVIVGAYASEIKLQATDPAQITIQTKTGENTVEADYIIAADGVESMIGRMAGIDTPLALSQSDAALQYRVSNIEVAPDCLQFFFGERYSPDGYLWVFPKSESSANIGLGLSPYGVAAPELKLRLEAFLADRYPHAKIDFVTCGMVPKFIGLEILGRDNLLLAGDAARTVDSISGAGISKALHTGKLAAEAVAESINGGFTRSRFQQQYYSAVESAIGRELNFYQRLYPILRKFDDRDWDVALEMLQKHIQKQTIESIDPIAIIKTIVKNSPSFFRLTRRVLF